MRRALHSNSVHDEDLAAPERAITAITQTVEHEREERPIDAMLDGRSEGVCVVMLHRKSVASELSAELRGESRPDVSGMKIVNDAIGPNAALPAQPEGALENRIGGCG